MSEVLSAPEASQRSVRAPSRRSQQLLALLNVRHEERWPVAMMWAHSFFLGLSVAYLTSSSLPIFLAAFDVRLLPEALFAAAVLQLSLGVVNDRLERRYAKSELIPLAVIVIIAGSALAFTGLLLLPTAIAAFAVLVWSRIQRSMVQSEFWGLTSILFDLRESKRLFSLIDSGSILAKIIGFFSVPLLLQFLPVTNLLLIAAAAPLVSFVIVRRIRSRYRLTIDHAAHASLLHRHGIGMRTVRGGEMRVEHRLGQKEGKESSVRSAFDFMLRHRYTASIGIVSMLAVIGMNAIDFGFLREIDLKYSRERNVASVLAMIFGSAQVLSLIVKTGFVGRVFQRFGAIQMSTVLPIVLLVISVGGLIASSTSGPVVMIWFFIAQAVFVEVYSDAVHEPAIAIAYQPLHGDERLRARKLVDDVVEPVSLAIGALILLSITLIPKYNLDDLSYLLLAVFAAWGVAGYWFVRQYRGVLRIAVKHKRIGGSSPTHGELLRAMRNTETGSHLSESERRYFELRALLHSQRTLSEQAFAHMLQEEIAYSKQLIGLHSNVPLLDRAITFERRQSAERILLVLALRFEPGSMLHIRDSLLAGDERHRANALEMLETILPLAVREQVLPILESVFVGGKHIHSVTLSIPTLKSISENNFYRHWTSTVASYFASEHTVMPEVFERVSLLHDVDLFSETPDAVLSTIANAMEEIDVPNGTQIISKGELGTCLYIIKRGKVKVHDGEHALALLGERTVVGELSLLDPEPRSASVTTLEDTTLLRLDWEVFYDLMTDNIEIARGALATLARRIRSQNEQIAKFSTTSS